MEEDVGIIIAGIITIIIFKPKKKEKVEKKKNLIYLIILFILKLVQAGFIFLYHYITKELCYYYENIGNTLNALELFFVTIGTFVLLKYKYYIHHIISLIISFLLSFAIDYILGNFSLLKYNYVFIFFLIYVMNDALIFCYLKYMMDKLFYHYSKLLLFSGIFGFLSKAIFFSGVIIYEEKNNIVGYKYIIKLYFETKNIFTIIFFQFFYFIVNGGLFYLTILLMLFYLSPNHIAIIDSLMAFLLLYIYDENPKKNYCIPLFVFQMFILLFYYEILELNFLGLNKNTAKNIKQRERYESETRDSIHSDIELGEEYLIKDEEIIHRKSSKGSNDSDEYNDELIDDKQVNKVELQNIKDNTNKSDEIKEGDLINNT